MAQANKQGSGVLLMYGDWRDRILDVFYGHIAEAPLDYWNDLRNYLLFGSRPLHPEVLDLLEASPNNLEQHLSASDTKEEWQKRANLIRAIWRMLPNICYGSQSKVRTWMEIGGLRRANDITQAG
jgi:hypothetical protein